MSVFYHNDDPLLHASIFQTQQTQPNVMNDAYIQMYKQQMMSDMQQQPFKDWLSTLDVEMRSLDATTAERLSENSQYTELNGKLQGLIQAEIMNLVKGKINMNQDAITNIKQQLDLIKTTSQQVKSEEKQNINELNDYLQNYSHLSFNEYKALKNGKKQEQETVEIINKEPKKQRIKS
jgi:hypothetical protein